MIFTSGWPQDPHDPEVLKEFIYRQVAGFKYNAIVWQMKAGYRYASWPRLANRCAMSREQVRDVIQFARDHGIELIPNTNILGHANWIVLKYKELQEDGKPHQLCTRHPQTYPMLFDVLEEMLDLFDHPARLHVGLDEVRWKTLNLPEEEQCPRCRGVPKWEIYAEHIRQLHDFLQRRGVREMWMWGDMLVARHNGGPPFDCARALDAIPTDIVIANWSAEYAQGSSRELAEKGFRVVKANSRQVPDSEAPHVFGNLASFWYRHPWCPMSHTGERGLMLQTAYAADFSWNINHENISLNQYRRERDLNVLRLAARQPVPAGAAESRFVELAAAVNRALVDREAGDGTGWADLGADQDLRAFPGGEVTVGPVRFRGAAGGPEDARAVYLTAALPESASVPVNRRIASLALLHTAVFPTTAALQKTFQQRFLAPNEGVPVVTCRVTYQGGDVIDVPLRIGMEVGNWLPANDGEYLVNCPYIFRLATAQRREQNPGTADAVLYVFEWVNPEPGKSIEALRFTHAGIEASYALLAVSAREPQ